jgi:hypothetical protein
MNIPEYRFLFLGVASMKRHLTLMSAVMVLVAGAGLAFAADASGKPETLKGTLECSKCELHETAQCGNVLSVKEGAKEVKYYLVDNELSKTDHKDVCMAPKKDVSVTGTVADKNGKMWLTATKIEFPK